MNIRERHSTSANQLAIAKYIKQVLDAPEDKPSMLPANSGLTDNGVSTQITSYNDMVNEA